MNEYYYFPKENMTLDELAAIVGWMATYATFYGYPPTIAERHFIEVTKEPEPEPTIWNKIGKFFS